MLDPMPEPEAPAINYARDTTTGEIVFLRGPGLPAASMLCARWAFWHLPQGFSPYTFLGRFIGETVDGRCSRLGHRPRACDQCRREQLT